MNLSLFNIICKSKIENKKEEILFQLYSKANEIIEEKLDIVGYLKFFEEYVLVKEILLDEFSNLCLTLRNRPKLFEKNNFVNVYSSKTERLKSLINHYTMKRNIFNDDSKIFKILDDQIQITLKTKFFNSKN